MENGRIFMELYETIEKRRTIRTYKKGASEEQIKRIILAGTKAPSAMNSQPWEFIVLDDPAIIERLAELKYLLNLKNAHHKGQKPEDIEKGALAQKESFRNASIVAVCNKREWERSVWMCIENMSLAAVAEGLGSGIVLYWEEKKEAAERLLGLPPDYELTAVLKLGEPGEEGFPRERNPFSPRRPEFSWLHRNRFSLGK
jgi:nitroreductase